MNKVKENPGQEVFPIDAVTVSAPESLNPVEYLNANAGFILLEDLPGFDLDWSRQVSMVGLMGEIGIALSEDPPQSEISDRALSVYGKDIENALPSVIERSLYYSRAKAWRRTDVWTVNWAEPRYTGPGVIGQDEGVAITSTEYRTVSKSAELLAKHASAHVGASHENETDDEEKVDDEDLKNRRGRGGAHAMEVRMRMLTGMNRTLQIEQIGLTTFRELAVFGKDTPKLPLGEMDIYRRLAMFPMLQMIKVAATQLDYGTNQREGAMRALTTIVSRWKRPERRVAAMQVYADKTNRYINAKRGKLSQAYSDCEIVYEKYKPFLATKEPTVDITGRS